MEEVINRALKNLTPSPPSDHMYHRKTVQIKYINPPLTWMDCKQPMNVINIKRYSSHRH